jgi:hypothetical protein
VHESFATAFGRALDRRRVSMTWLRDRLAARGHPVSLASLSYWRSGQRVPTRVESLDALGEVEALLDVAPGTLAALAREARHDRRAPAPFDGLVLGGGADTLRGERDVDRVLFHMVVDVDRPGRVITAEVTQVFVAAREGVRGVSMFIGPDGDGATNSTAVEAVSGCRIGTPQDRGDGIRSVWLDFDRPCRAGESVVTVTRVVDAGDQAAAETEYGIVAEQRLEECFLLVRFHPDAVPARAWVAFQEGAAEAEWEVELDGRRSVHYRQTGFGPGVARVRWAW